MDNCVVDKDERQLKQINIARMNLIYIGAIADIVSALDEGEGVERLDQHAIAHTMLLVRDLARKAEGAIDKADQLIREEARHG